MRLLIAIPTLDYIHVQFMERLLKLIESLNERGVDYEVKIKSGTLVYLAREELTAYAINEGFTHTLWLDSDMVFEEETFDDLYDTGKDFVCGIFHARRPGHQSCIFKNLTPPDRYRWDEYPTDTFRIKGCGMACTLVKTDVMKAVREHFGTCFTPAFALGEDLAFCKRADEMGIEIWCEPTVRVGHIGHIAIYPEDEGRFLNNLQRR